MASWPSVTQSRVPSSRTIVWLWVSIDRIVPRVSSAAAVSVRPSVSASANPNIFRIGDLLRQVWVTSGYRNWRAGIHVSQCVDFARTWPSRVRWRERFTVAERHTVAKRHSVLVGHVTVETRIPDESGDQRCRNQSRLARHGNFEHPVLHFRNSHFRGAVALADADQLAVVGVQEPAAPRPV